MNDAPSNAGTKHLVTAMRDFAPRPWCKHAVVGAAHAQVLDIYAFNGNVRAYLPRWKYPDANSKLPRLLQIGPNPGEIIPEYGLEIPDELDGNDIVVWNDAWTDEPKRIALGWLVFTEPWEWESPAITYEYFDIPKDYEPLFAGDDLHPEGDPDTRLTYDFSVNTLAVTLDHAELFVPMANFSNVTKRLEPKVTIQRGKIGRPKGAGGFVSSDIPIVEKMMGELRENPLLTHRSLAEKYVSEAMGHGTVESKIKRLESRLRERY